MATAGVKLPPLTAETVVVLGDVPSIEYIRTGTKEAGEMISNVIANHSVIILKNHGVFAVGANLREAVDKVETLEHAAWLALVEKIFGSVIAMPSDEVKFFRSYVASEIKTS
jgi:ribulose-5-phosphate 4-epimerase/fuculose-1-phosphate aldolase